jgi:tetratricopeptide (TPR) repeat protein
MLTLSTPVGQNQEVRLNPYIRCRWHIAALRATAFALLSCLLVPVAAVAQTVADGPGEVRALLEARDYRSAQLQAAAWLERHPDDAEVWELLGRAQKERWLFKAAAGSYERAQKLGRENAQLLREWIEAKARGTSKVSLVFRVGRLKRTAERALELDPLDVRTRAALAAYYYMVPGFLGGDKKEADRLIEELVALSAADGYYLHGLRAKEEEAPDETILRYWETALSHDSEHTLTLLDMGTFWKDRDELERSLGYLERAAASAPDDAQILTAYARGFRRMDRFEESAIHFQRALDVNPYYAPARLNLAEYHEKHGEKQDAIREYTNLARFNPTYQEKEVRRRLRRLMR